MHIGFVAHHFATQTVFKSLDRTLHNTNSRGIFIPRNPLAKKTEAKINKMSYNKLEVLALPRK